jgi:hypothetical protein
MDRLDAAPPEVVAAMDALQLDSAVYSEHCAAATLRGTRCTRFRLGYADVCRQHLTADQKADLANRLAAAQAIMNGYFGSLSLTEPACWLWPVTKTAVNALRQCRSAGDVLNESRAIYYAMFDWQRGCCAACGNGGRPDVDGDVPDDNMVLDHDHLTGLVRGWLCRSCNIREGKGGGQLFGRYRERPPAKILGVEVWYFDERHGVWAEPPESLSGEVPGYRISGLLTPETEERPTD